MKKVLITGGAGFIGYHLARQLLNCNYSVDLLDNFSRGICDAEITTLSKNDNINLINVDLLKPDMLDTIGNNDYQYIYHLAAIIGVQHVLENPYSVLENNFILLRNILDFAKKQKKIKRFIFASTSEVYAGTLRYYGIKFPTPESTPLTVHNLQDSRTSYMLSKIYGEALCIQSGLPVTIIRPHNFYGPRMGLSHVVPELMKKIIESKINKIGVYSANHKRTFCYIIDAVQMIQLLSEADEATGKAFNIGNDDEELTMKELAQKIITLIGKNIKVDPLSATPGSPERRCPSIEKIRSVISYQKKYYLKEGLKETFDWYNKFIFSGKEESAI